jgi:flagellar hook assembly protein FlgD
LPGTSNVQIKIYDLNGRLVKSLLDETKDAGNYSIIWDSKDNLGISVSAGSYFYQIQIGSYVQAKKMVLVK